MTRAHPQITALPPWDGSIEGARALQPELAARVQPRDGFARPLEVVAGFHCSIENGGAMTHASAVLLDANDLSLIAAESARVATPIPYVAGLQSFRSLPALLEVLSLLPRVPDLAFVAGHGIAHPQRLGVAAHFGVVADLPCIGVADKVVLGTAAYLQQVRGAYTPLREGGTQIGWLLRSKLHLPPVAVSPGHRVAMASAAGLVMRFVEDDRLPEPIRLAQRSAPLDASGS